ncbi:shikimate kinase [Erythrobacter sp. EC-HK427]|uniref:shikimate kinase n=1 Tax=Erythrobacter sp. EC-HK427 TaxID=2038396 RepID=UPI00125EC0DF|nr:shikimate kinase [Erythrobacter sp. EC-HK427]
MAIDESNSVIVLVGHSGVGKSTLGPTLAEALNYNFFDVDAEIASISDGGSNGLSTRRGLLQGLSRCNQSVIAAGYEDFSDEIMGPQIKERVFSVWIKAAPNERLGKTVIGHLFSPASLTSFNAISRLEQDKLFSFADLTVSIGSLDIPEASKLLIDTVKAALPLRH